MSQPFVALSKRCKDCRGKVKSVISSRVEKGVPSVGKQANTCHSNRVKVWTTFRRFLPSLPRRHYNGRSFDNRKHSKSCEGMNFPANTSLLTPRVFADALWRAVTCEMKCCKNHAKSDEKLSEDTWPWLRSHKTKTAEEMCAISIFKPKQAMAQ